MREDRPKAALLTDVLVWAAVITVIVVDQISKGWVTRALLPGQSWPDTGFFQITQARNTGTIFGLFQGSGFVLTIISFLAIAGLIVFFKSSSFQSKLLRLALGLMVGGAIGNLIDRIRLGYVVDFIHVGPWPIFNLSDSSIVIGIAIIAWTAIFRPSEIHQVEEAGDDSEQGPPSSDRPPRDEYRSLTSEPVPVRVTERSDQDASGRGDPERP